MLVVEGVEGVLKNMEGRERGEDCDGVKERDVREKGGGGGGGEFMDGDDEITEGQREEGEWDDENHEMLKLRISAHPLYHKLVEVHLNCLQVGGFCKVDSVNHKVNLQHEQSEAMTSMPCQSELDQFMEAYCSALTKLKEAMEEPQQETMAFINSMHSQLKELTSPHPASPSPLP